LGLPGYIFGRKKALFVLFQCVVTGRRPYRTILYLLQVYLHREPHCSDPFDMQFVYEDMPQESGSYQCRAAHIVQTDMQTNINIDTDIDTDMDMDIGV